jgi:hypothetical protein
MKSHEVAEHILAQIDEVIQSGELNKWHSGQGGGNSLTQTRLSA